MQIIDRREIFVDDDDRRLVADEEEFPLSACQAGAGRDQA
jgi:hypothetical protein